MWTAIERIESHVAWMADAVRIEPTSDASAGVGASFTCDTRVGPLRTRDALVVTEWVPGRRLAIEHRGVVRGTGVFDLRPTGDTTEFCWREELRFPWWMGGPLGERLARPVLRRVWQGNLRRLRRRVEAPSDR